MKHAHMFQSGRGPQSTHWAFTVHRPQRRPAALPSGVQYLVYQIEKTAEGKRHIQAYVQFPSRCFGTKVSALAKQYFGGEPSHNEAAKGSDQENETYCTKEESRLEGPWRYGERVPHAGKKGGRSDLMKLKDNVDKGVTELELFEQQFGDMVRHHRAIGHYKYLKFNVERHWETICILIVGPTNTQKTFLSEILARSGHFGKTIWRAPESKGSGMYFDGYNGHEVVLWQDFDGGSCKFGTFKNLIQGTPTTVPVHGAAAIQWAPRCIIMTSNYLPKYWWKSHQGANDLAAIYKRIHVIFKRLRPVAKSKARGLLVTADLYPPRPDPPLPQKVQAVSKSKKLYK